MKGAVFIALNEMIEQKHGLNTWEALLDDVKPACDGVYVSTENYPDADIVAFVAAISKRLSVPSTDVTRIFGHFLFSELNTKFPLFSQTYNSLFPFLDSIEGVIHKEVRKLFVNPSLPTLDCTLLDENRLEIQYHSPRKLCYLAEGLIQGAAQHFNESIHLEHLKCMHEGAEKCTFIVNKTHDN